MYTYHISSNNSRGRLLFFVHKKAVIIRGIALSILFYYKKMITSNKLNIGFLSVPTNFQCLYLQRQSLNCYWSDLLDQTTLQLDSEGTKEREDSERSGGEGGGGSAVRLFLIFPSKRGNYSREAINQGTAISQGNMECVTG